MRLPRGAHGVAKWCKSGAQLGLALGRKSKIRDGYAERKDRPRGAAVADFRFTSPYEPQLRPQSTRFTRTDPVPNSKANRVVLRVVVLLSVLPQGGHRASDARRAAHATGRGITHPLGPRSVAISGAT